MNRRPEQYYAKILLFGEYAVLFNSMGLSIPYTHFKGELSFIDENKYTDRQFARRSNEELSKFSFFLKENKLDDVIKLEALNRDIAKGLYFESSIPESYGLGSSGALCAAIYKKYARKAIPNNRIIKTEQITELKAQFSQLESGFHGQSSGLDPLNSYLKLPLLIHNSQKIELVTLPGRKFGQDSAIFLVDTDKQGNTAPLVKAFLKKCEEEEYSEQIKQEFIPLNNNCIQELIKGESTPFFNNVAKLSSFQLEHFRSMIPDEFLAIWELGLENKMFSLKLCGSGGGGFLLGFTQNYSQTQELLKDKGHKIVTVYQNN
ncbi:mevalonate kinase [Ancylomarina salipaludis]|uniref:Mevalonate kinase n=1 Tax=Ancylomarina salipaludis TaxID=2501299 RepID=A0A4Q1JK69_9BACT|nr:mevalonate kinase [Ancylomarina salipaludis]RXQ92955.1 mevalonate kinase [Ancylomarina salipaludis]